jgi:hypothetical protein
MHPSSAHSRSHRGWHAGLSQGGADRRDLADGEVSGQAEATMTTTVTPWTQWCTCGGCGAREAGRRRALQSGAWVVAGEAFPATTWWMEALGSNSDVVRCSCAWKEAERWSGGAGPAEQCALVSHAQLVRGIPGDGGVITSYQGEHRM